MPSPPKPWERAGSMVATPSSMPIATAQPQSQQTAGPSSSSAATPLATTAQAEAPSVPQRPGTLTSQQAVVSASRYASPYSTLPTSSYTSPYSYGASTYASPYSRFGTTGGYGGYGGYGGGAYGGYGGLGGGGYGMPYGGGMGMAGYDPMTGQPSLIQQVESSTSQTFALIQSIVGTFTGFAQMLESTFMATHSSFFAMLGVAEQFTQLKMALGQVVGLFGFIGWLRGWWKGDRGNMRDDFKRFLKGEDPTGAGTAKPSRKPLIVFLVAVFGLPYLMHRVIRHIASRVPPPQPQQLGPDGQPIPTPIIDPANLTFARAMYPFDTKDPVELSLAKGELVAVLLQHDPVTGEESEWWRGRTREGREGWFPRVYVEVVKTKKMDADTVVPSITDPTGKTVS